MKRLFIESHAKGTLLVKGAHGFFLRLRGRPMNERKAMFFATFVIASALVISFWTNQMYHRFGIVFLGGASSPQATAETLQTESAPAPEGELKRPFAVALENISILKEDFINLFSNISSGLDAAKSGEPPDAGSPTSGASGKEPPLASSGAADEPQKPPTGLPKDVKAKNTAKPSLSAPAPETKPALSDAIAPIGESKNDKGKEPPLVVYSDANQNQTGGGFSVTQAQEKKEPQAETQAVATQEVREGRPSPIISIVMNNLAAMRQAFVDLYQYLTQ